MGQQILGGALLGLSRGFEGFRQASREDQLFDLQRQSALLDIRQRELDITRTNTLLDAEREQGLRDEEIHGIEVRLQSAAATKAERALDFEEKYGERIAEAQLQASEIELFEAGLQAEATQLNLDMARLNMADFEARRSTFPPEQQAALERQNAENVARVSGLEAQLEEARNKFLLTPGADGKTPLETDMEFNLEAGQLSTALQREQLEAAQFDNDTAFARTLMASEDPAKSALGFELFTQAASELDPEVADRLASIGTEKPEDLTVERGPSLASQIFGFNPGRALEKAAGPETSGRIDKLRKIDEFGRKTFRPSFGQFLRDAPAGPLARKDSFAFRFATQGEVGEDSTLVHDPDKGENVPRAEFTFEIPEQDRDRILRSLAESSPEEFAKYQSLPENEQRIFLARQAANDPKIKGEIFRLPPVAPGLVEIALSALGPAGRIPAIARGAAKANRIPGFTKLFKPAKEFRAKPPPRPKRTFEPFPRPPDASGVNVTSGPLPQLPGPPQQPIVQRLLEGPARQQLLGPPNAIPSAPARGIVRPLADPPNFPASQLTPEEMEVVTKALLESFRTSSGAVF